ncbi:hypothetical protein F4808DRAFT_153525 [Astrocystis sublimbata]|nr:hypothetical protein F4808DRAFT_153525 [Astrocystis sublimbata]
MFQYAPSLTVSAHSPARLLHSHKSHLSDHDASDDIQQERAGLSVEADRRQIEQETKDGRQPPEILRRAIWGQTRSLSYLGRMPTTHRRFPRRILFTSREEAEDFVAGRKTSAATDSGDKFYAVAVGRVPGIYTDWDVASGAIKGWKAPKYKKFATREEAIEFIRAHGNEAAQEWLLKEGAEPPSKRARKTKDESSEFAQDEPGVTRIFTDGSSLANGRAGATAGVGVFFSEGDER